jgi:hypothetical protein
MARVGWFLTGLVTGVVLAGRALRSPLGARRAGLEVAADILGFWARLIRPGRRPGRG